MRFAVLGGLLAAGAAALLFLTAAEPWTLRLDNRNVIYPLTLAAYRGWTGGVVPAWTNGLWAGFPLLAEPQTAGFYLPHVLPFWMTPDPHLRAFDVATALHVGVFVAGMMALAAALGATRPAIVLAGLCTLLDMQFGWWSWRFLPCFVAIAWWPWALLAAERLADDTRAPAPALLLGSAALAAQALGGYPEFALYGGVFAALWLVTRRRVRLRTRVLRVALLAGLAALLAAPQLVPSAIEMSTSIRSGTPPGASIIAVPPRPALFLDPRSGARDVMPAFVGVCTLALAVVAVVARTQRALFLAAVAATCALVSLGDVTPLYGLLTAVPPFNLFRGPHKFLLLAELAIVLLAAGGFTALGTAVRHRRAALTVGIVLALGAVGERAVCLAGSAWAFSHTVMYPTDWPLDALLAPLRTTLLPWARPPDVEPPPRVLAEASEYWATSLPMLYGIESLRGGVPGLLSARHDRILNRPVTPRDLDRFGVQLVVTKGSSCPLQSGRLTLVADAQGLCVFANRSGRRYELLAHAVVAESPDALQSLTLDPSVVPPAVLAPASVLATHAVPIAEPGSVRVERYRPGDVALHVEAAAPRLLLIRESVGAGWQAFVDDVPAPVYAAAGVFFAVPVPAGVHDVRLRYVQPGLGVGLGAACLWLVIAAVTMWRRRT